ncbi:MAG: transketolase family protein [Flexilinea sp.]
MLGGEREGVTHQAFEDVGIMRTIPGITVLTPADQYQVYGAVKTAAGIDGPVYIRCASGREPVVYQEDVSFTFGKNRIVREYGSDVTIFSSGFVLDRCIAAAEQLKQKGVNITLVDVSTIKPLDIEGTELVLRKCGCAVTVEDHNVIGGLGSAIAEISTDVYPVPVVRVGLQDIFPESGEAASLLDKYHIGVSDIVHAAFQAKNKKSK